MLFCGCFFQVSRNCRMRSIHWRNKQDTVRKFFWASNFSQKLNSMCLIFFKNYWILKKNSLPISFKMHKSASFILCTMWVCLKIYMSQYADNADQNKNKCNSFVFKFNIQSIHNEILKKKFTNFFLSQSWHSSDPLCQKNKTWD